MGENEHDVLRDGPLRYLGYANELGESFRPVFPALYYPSYAVAFGYVFADCYQNVRRQQEKNGTSSVSETRKSALMMEKGVDALLWQTMASVILPGYTINRAVKHSQRFLRMVHVKKYANLSVPVVRWFPTVVGIAVIPLIVHPIDTFVHYVMDNSVRPKIKKMVYETV